MVDATAEAAGKVLYIFAFPSSEEWREQVWTFVGIFSDSLICLICLAGVQPRSFVHDDSRLTVSLLLSLARLLQIL